MVHRSRAGFTFIELITVVVVIGVLASAAVAKYGDFTNRQRKNTCISHQDRLRSAIRQVQLIKAPLIPDTVMRLRTDGIIDPTPLAASTDNFRVFVGELPSSWGRTDLTTNSAVRSAAADERIFRCPEDVEALGVTYSGISNVVTQNVGTPSEARPGTVEGSFGGSSDPRAYTFAKMVFSTRQSFSPASPSTSLDPLEGFNWIDEQVMWQQSEFTFCRRWGRRNPDGSGSAPLAGLSGDENYLPAQQGLFAHTDFAPQQ